MTKLLRRALFCLCLMLPEAWADPPVVRAQPPLQTFRPIPSAGLLGPAPGRFDATRKPSVSTPRRVKVPSVTALPFVDTQPRLPSHTNVRININYNATTENQRTSFERNDQSTAPRELTAQVLYHRFQAVSTPRVLVMEISTDTRVYDFFIDVINGKPLDNPIELAVIREPERNGDRWVTEVEASFEALSEHFEPGVLNRFEVFCEEDSKRYARQITLNMTF